MSVSTTADDAAIAEAAPAHVVGPLLAGVLHDPRWSDADVGLIAGGRSNLTFRVSSPAGEVVLRRPPLGHVLPTAHDMSREFAALTALEPTPVPVPRPLYFDPDPGALGASFFVMDRVLGHVVVDALPEGYADEPAQRGAIGRGLVDALAALHVLRPDDIGLGDFGRPSGFVSRQLRRWSQQWERSKTGDLPVLDRLLETLAASQPAERSPTVVHGDFRLDNCILHPTRPGHIAAVLDWEMSTLGDPLADLGALLMYWSEPDDDDLTVAGRIVPPVTAQAGFPSRADIVQQYAEQTGFDVTDVGWYRAFAHFKLAVICQGIVARASAGAMLGQRFDDMAAVIEPLAGGGLRLLGAER